MSSPLKKEAEGEEEMLLFSKLAILDRLDFADDLKEGGLLFVLERCIYKCSKELP